MKTKLTTTMLTLTMWCAMTTAMAQTYQVPVSEAHEQMLAGKHEPTWQSQHYGHPSEFGFKDVLPLFKAEKWDPEALVERYKRCGAQYFFVLGNHHDNYDLWDSQYQEWNSKNIGPKKDILEID